MAPGEPERRAVVLLSGGLDSATTLALALDAGLEAYALTVRYGQKHGLEIERAKQLAARQGATEHRVVDVDLVFARSALTQTDIQVPKGRSHAQIASGIPVTYVPARNTLLLTLALAWAETLPARHLFIGINAIDYSGYPDCRAEFLEAYRKMAALATKAGVEGAPLEIHAPLLEMTKADVVRRADELGVDFGLTLSCYDPDAQGSPCGECDACRLRAKGFREAGLVDPAAAGPGRLRS